MPSGSIGGLMRYLNISRGWLYMGGRL